MLLSLIILSLVLLVICVVLVSIVIKLKGTLTTERAKHKELTSNYNQSESNLSNVIKHRDKLNDVIKDKEDIILVKKKIIEGLEADVKYTENLASLYFKKYLESLRLKKGYKIVTPVQDIVVECYSGKSPKEIYELYKHSEVSNIIGQDPQQKLIVCGYNETSIILGSTDFNGMRSLPNGFVGSKTRYLSYSFLFTSTPESQNEQN
jgi:hypothetical protein